MTLTLTKTPSHLFWIGLTFRKKDVLIEILFFGWNFMLRSPTNKRRQVSRTYGVAVFDGSIVLAWNAVDMFDDAHTKKIVFGDRRCELRCAALESSGWSAWFKRDIPVPMKTANMVTVRIDDHRGTLTANAFVQQKQWRPSLFSTTNRITQLIMVLPSSEEFVFTVSDECWTRESVSRVAIDALGKILVTPVRRPSALSSSS